MRERKIHGEGLERERKKPPRVTRPTLRNKNSLYAELLLRIRRSFCIPSDTRYSAFQSVQRIHSSPMVSLGIPWFLSFLFTTILHFLYYFLLSSLICILSLIIPLTVFTQQQTKRLKCLL